MGLVGLGIGWDGLGYPIEVCLNWALTKFYGVTMGIPAGGRLLGSLVKAGVFFMFVKSFEDLISSHL